MSEHPVQQVSAEHGEEHVGPGVERVEQLVARLVHAQRLQQGALQGSWVVEAEVGAEGESADEEEDEQSVEEGGGVQGVRELAEEPVLPLPTSRCVS